MGSLEAELNKRYGVTVSLLPGTFEEAKKESVKQRRLLLVYLHCASHPHTAEFCRTTLGNSAVAHLVHERFLFWGADVDTRDGYAVASKLDVTRFPFLAVVYRASSHDHVLLDINGSLDAANVMSHLNACLDNNDAYLASVRADDSERVFREQLRDQQRRELEEVHRIEEERQRAEDEAQRRLQAEAEAEKAKAEAARRAEEEQRKAEEKKAVVLAENKARSAARLPPVPTTGECAHIRLTQLNGRPVERKFLLSESVETLRDFAISQEEYQGQEFTLVTGFPPKPIPMTGTFADNADLHPRAVVLMREVL